ncbi:SusC/RagA family TonB-linked outer membrane protein [Belliella kenyensis]|uniref:SusC/RagA family TonB-linked outer membrane protein n=1 Tax=Belliella kenyensis TaxID=1472724 RepID=A0ABV8EH99_9BACT|nr:SusC/RagA family TonB-linked outer membrane protein [Belliella kenyensis]MCH7401159.1 SusC/RagA family TonB-linked outer membrane protein [Belliella kenyensis]MDN3604156.1 SusC/RagA family TonB-linked outer membrane protein [Belliella kenyensis]
MKFKFYYVLFLFVFTGLDLQAQHTLRGMVVSDSDQAPFVGATIIANGNNNRGTVSALDGTFTLDVPEVTGEVTVSFIGMETQVLRYNVSDFLRVSLSESMSNLDEFMVIGYGTAKRADLTTSVGQLEQVARTADRPISSVQQMLQGQIAGVSVVSGSGDPGSTPQVVIRGVGTFANESPLYVVDGMPYYGGRINPNDIETLTVLKDAAAAAIYGAQAASGVIVITTKSGKSGAPKVALDVYRGIQAAYKTPQALNAAEYAQAYRNAAAHAGAIAPAAHDPAQNPWGQVTRTNWMDEIFRTAAVSNLNLQLSGGSEKSRYSSSFGYHKKEGLLLNTDYELFSFRIKADYDITNKFRLGHNVYFNREISRGTNTGSSYSGAIINAIYMNPAAPVYDEEGRFHGTVPFELSQFAGAYGDTYNPVSLLLRPNVNSPRLNMNAIAYGEYDILEDLTFRSSFSIDLWSWTNKSFSPRAPEIGRPSNMNFLNQGSGNSSRWIWDQQVNYNKSLGSHNFALTGVYTAQYRQEESFSFQVQDFDREDDWFQYAGNAGAILNIPSSGAFEDVLTSAIGRLMYDYDDRYFAMGSIRRDETSRLPASTKSDYFYAASAAWKISSESFFNVPAINLLKLRGSWGQIGNISSVGNYAFNVPLAAGNNVILGDPGFRNRHLSINEMTNPNLRWERSETVNVGLDATLLSNKLNVALEYYEKYTRGLIQRNSPDPHSGVPTGALANVGTVANKGIELSLSYAGQAGRLKYNVGGNIATIKNTLQDLDDFTNDFIQHTQNLRSIIYPFRSEPGQPLYSYHLIPHLGIFQNQAQIDQHVNAEGVKIQPNARPGDLIFQDVNGDGRISDADRVFMGNAMPDFNYGININFEYRNFDLQLFGQGVSGVKLFNGYKFSTYNAGLQGYNLDRRVLDAWTPSNPNATIPVLSTQDPNANFGQASDWFLEKGDYFRIKNLSLGYTVPDFVWRSLKPGTNLRIYLAAENLFTFTPYTGLDPEVGAGPVIDNGTFPLPRTFTVGLNLNL